MRSYIVETQIYDDIKNHVATIKAFDEAAATVTIEGKLFNTKSWGEVSKLIEADLKRMELEGDEEI